VEEVRIHSGSRIKLKRVDADRLPRDFVERLREYAHREERIQAIYVFALEPEGQAEQVSVALAIKSGLFAKKDESFLQVVDEIQMLLPEDLPINLYRFGASEFLARYCLSHLEALYLRSASWEAKQRKKLGKTKTAVEG
jgi:hypothetical protein